MDNGNLPSNIPNVVKKTSYGIMRHRLDDYKLGIMVLGKVLYVQGEMPAENKNTIIIMPTLKLKGSTKKVNIGIIQMYAPINI